MTGYRFDADRLERTAALLYGLVPEFLKARDHDARLAQPPQPEELRALIEILAAPLAAVRQSIEELYADLFADTASEEALPLLADSIALDLVFRDAGANRRDLMAAMTRRQRKGTPEMLEEMARTLFGGLVTAQEGWKQAQIAQDLNILRLERTAPDLRRASSAERASGPLASFARAADARPIGARTGQVHPRHMTYWVFPSRFFPLTRADPFRLPNGPADLRFAFDAANAWRPLRVRAVGFDDKPGTDRVPEGHFAEDPGRWFAREGRFAVRIAGLPAAAIAQPMARDASRIPAHLAILDGTPTLEVMSFDGRRTSGAVEIALMAAPIIPATQLPDTVAAVLRGALTVDPSGTTAAAGAAGATPVGAVAMLRLTPAAGAASRLLGRTVIAIAGSGADAVRASAEASLAESGYLRGALFVTLHEMRVAGPQWLYVAADGSTHAADRPLDAAGGNVRLPERAALSGPNGPAWPAALESRERNAFAPLIAAPGAPPTVMHGLRALAAGGTLPLPAGERAAVVFAVTYFDMGIQTFQPMLRLAWFGDGSSSAEWQVVSAAGTVSQGGQHIPLHERFAALAKLIADGAPGMALALRFETSAPGAILTPGEIAFTAINGRAVLIHLPELAADAPSIGGWPRGLPPIQANSIPLQVGEDGSTWIAGTNLCRRAALGQAAPLRAPALLTRRMPRWRRLCAWQNETVTEHLDPAPPRTLDIDPRFGVFAMAASDPPQPHPPGPAPAHGSVGVDMQAGASMEIGALPMDRDRFLNRLPLEPTRFVSKAGRYSGALDAKRIAQTLHRTLREALLAIAADAQRADTEIVRIEDSAFYAGEALDWPAGIGHLVVCAAPGERPVIEVAQSNAGTASYASLEVSGIAFMASAALFTFALPPAQSVRLSFVSVFQEGLTLRPVIREAAGAERLEIERCALGALAVAEPCQIRIADSILDAGPAAGAAAIGAAAADLVMDRATVIGEVRAERVDISDSILASPVTAGERFEGCIRFSLLAPGGTTPRKHRVISVDAVTGEPIKPRFVSRGRRDPAYLRLHADGDPQLAAGASDGGEVGAFNRARTKEILDGVMKRIVEHTPAGLRPGLVRQD